MAGQKVLSIFIVAIESVRGLYNVREICHGPRVVAIALGAEDYRADLRTGKHKPAVELLFARQNNSSCSTRSRYPRNLTL